jgi:hypothetical protein
MAHNCKLLLTLLTYTVQCELPTSDQVACPEDNNEANYENPFRAHTNTVELTLTG